MNSTARYALLPERSTVAITARAPGHDFRCSGAGIRGAVELAGEILVALEASFDLAALKASDALGQRELKKYLRLDRHPVMIARLLEPGPLAEPVALRFTLAERSAELRTQILAPPGSPRKGQVEFSLSLRALGLEPPKLLFLKVDEQIRVSIRAVLTHAD